MLLAHAAHALPDVDIELREMVSTVQIDALASRMLDAGFVRQRARQPLEYRLVQREPMLVAVAEGAPLAACERIGPTISTGSRSSRIRRTRGNTSTT